MVDFKKRLRDSQGGSDFVKLPIVKSLSVKEHESTPMFIHWNKETEQNEGTEEQISGIYIGGAMKLTAYDDNLGSKGGNYFSSYYFNRDNLVLFEPGKMVKSVCKGNMDEIEKWIATNTTSKMAKKKWCFFVLTKDGLIEIQTNLSIAIDHIKKFNEPLKEKYACFVPAMFTQDNEDISNACKKMLGKFATKNPPAYARLTVGDFITEEDFNNWGAEECIDTFIKWKKQVSVSPDKSEKPPASESDDELPPEFNPEFERID